MGGGLDHGKEGGEWVARVMLIQTSIREQHGLNRPIVAVTERDQPPLCHGIAAAVPTLALDSAQAKPACQFQCNFGPALSS